MPYWHSKKELYRACRETFGHNEAIQEAYLDMEPAVARLWTAGEHDFSYYSSPFYAYESVTCFAGFTKGATRWFARWAADNVGFYGKRLNEVLDYGCGVGASSRLFTELTGIGTIAHYYGGIGTAKTMEPGTCPKQMLVGTAICQGSQVTHVASSSPQQLRTYQGLHWDGVMAFELFEHELDPVALFDDLVKEPNTWIVCEASSFTTGDKYGHFPVYNVGEEAVDRRAMPRRWRRELEARGWVLADSGWNARPKVWVRL
jgi:hypothetical protein